MADETHNDSGFSAGLDPESAIVAFAPGRVNLIGEHTDYNDGLALPFAIERGVTITAVAVDGEDLHVVARGRESVRVPLVALDLAAPVDPDGDWRAFVRGAVAELAAAGHVLRAARLRIEGDIPEGAGLSSSAALEVSLCLALLEVARTPPPAPVELARLCARIERKWVGAHTGLLDQLSSILGRDDTAIRIDFRNLEIRAVPIALGEWRLAVVDSGEAHRHVASGYNVRRAECAEATALLGHSLREADEVEAARLPPPLASRVRHVVTENRRVDAAVAALDEGDCERLGALLDASHASLRDQFEVSTATVDQTVVALKDAGAAGARMIGGGFGGYVLGLFPPGLAPPRDALVVRPSAGARIVKGASEV